MVAIGISIGDVGTGGVVTTKEIMTSVVLGILKPTVLSQLVKVTSAILCQLVIMTLAVSATVTSTVLGQLVIDTQCG